MKTLRAFTGFNSYGVTVEVAESATGHWYQRSYGWNGFGMAWTKWESFADPTWSTKITNHYSGITEDREEPMLEYGFSLLTEYPIAPKYRLPA